MSRHVARLPLWYRRTDHLQSFPYRVVTFFLLICNISWVLLEFLNLSLPPPLPCVMFHREELNLGLCCTHKMCIKALTFVHPSHNKPNWAKREITNSHCCSRDGASWINVRLGFSDCSSTEELMSYRSNCVVVSAAYHSCTGDTTERFFQRLSHPAVLPLATSLLTEKGNAVRPEMTTDLCC